MRTVRILGGGPAGSCAALAALGQGAAVELIERSHFPRHKVCGEFLSPEIAEVFDSVGVLGRFSDLGPSRVRRMGLHIGDRSRWDTLPEPAFGLSRYALDDFLFRSALSAGAVKVESGAPDVVATGRPPLGTPSRSRLFGFKAHFAGPADDAVELFFSGPRYVGVNCVEGGVTNVCGLAPEAELRGCNFEIDGLLARSPALGARLLPLHRVTRWFFAGPLEFAQRWRETRVLPAGDALSFVDPFTGSGLLCAARTGVLAGAHAARSAPVEAYLGAAKAALSRPFAVSSVLRRIAQTDWAERLLPLVPGRLLFRLSRPR